MNLDDLKIGETGRIVKISASGIIKRKLLDMGFIRGQTVTIAKRALFRYPIDVVIKGYHVSLRKEEAEKIIIEMIEE